MHKERADAIKRMRFYVLNQSEVPLTLLLEIALYVAIPCFLFAAYKGWAKRGRQELPRWRNWISVASMTLTCAVWLWITSVGFSRFANLRVDLLSGAWMTANIFASTLAVIASLALKGRPRMAALAAAVLTAAPVVLDYARGV